MTVYINNFLKKTLRVISLLILLVLLATALLACVPHEQNFTPSDPNSGEVSGTSVTTTTTTTQHIGEPDPTSRKPVIGKPVPPNRDTDTRHTTVTTTTTMPELSSETTTTTTIARNIAAKPVGKVGKAHSIRVFEDVQITVIYGLDEAGQEIPIEAFYCSTGAYGRTPKAPEGKPLRMTAYRPTYMRFSLLGNSYVRYPTHIYGDYFFHSIPYEYNPDRGPAYNECWVNGMKALGNYASTGGCIRLSVRDAAKLQSYAYRNMPVYVLQNSSGYSWPTPLGIPGVQWGSPYTISDKLGWDPTDWHQDNPYKALTPPTTTEETTVETTPEETTVTTTTTPVPTTSETTVKPTRTEKPTTTSTSSTTSKPAATTTTTSQPTPTTEEAAEDKSDNPTTPDTGNE
ncbi:MAG: L,D-transpeptidase [Eubacteriales bacterium]|nr:L,D-transpeptidase [Eubacteriales bacterium]